MICASVPVGFTAGRAAVLGGCAATTEETAAEARAMAAPVARSRMRSLLSRGYRADAEHELLEELRRAERGDDPGGYPDDRGSDSLEDDHPDHVAGPCAERPSYPDFAAPTSDDVRQDAVNANGGEDHGQRGEESE